MPFEIGTGNAGHVAVVATPLTLITPVRSSRTSMMTIDKVCRLAGESCASNMYNLCASLLFIVLYVHFSTCPVSFLLATLGTSISGSLDSLVWPCTHVHTLRSFARARPMECTPPYTHACGPPCRGTVNESCSS